MSVSHSSVVDAFFNGRKATGGNMFTDGTTIYSYGAHFPIATRLNDGSYLRNNDRYSITTSGHQSMVGFPEGTRVYKCTTDEIIQAVRYPGYPIILTKFKDYTNMDQVFGALHDVVAKENTMNIPIRRWRDRIEDDISISKIRKAANSKEPYDRRLAGGYLKQMHHLRKEEAVKMVIKLTKDEDVRISALSSLMGYMPSLRGKLLQKVDKILKEKTTGIIKNSMKYVGSINSRYPGRSDDESISILMFMNEEEDLFFRKCSTWRCDSMAKLDGDNVTAKDMVVGKMETALGTLETTCTINEELYDIIPVILAIEAL